MSNGEKPSENIPATPTNPVETKLVTPPASRSDLTKPRDLLKNEVDMSAQIRQKWASIDTPFIGIKNEFLSKQIKESVQTSVQEALSSYPNLTPKQKSNIELAVLGKICNSNWFTELGRLAKDDVIPVIQLLIDGKYDEANALMKKGIARVDALNDKLSGALNNFDMKKAMPTLVAHHFAPIKSALDMNKNNPALLAAFLDSPEAMTAYAGGPLPLNITPPTSESLSKYCAAMNKQISLFDTAVTQGKAAIADSGKTLSDLTSSLSPEIQKMIKEFLESLIDIPFIGPIIAALFGIKKAPKPTSPETIKTPQTAEQKAMKETVDTLQTYGALKDATGKEAPGKNNGKVEILKNKDLSKLDYTKLKGFFDFAKKYNIDTKSEAFWLSVFTGTPVLQVKKTDGTDAVVMFPKFEATDLDNGFAQFYEKCNKIADANTHLVTPKDKEIQKKKVDVIGMIRSNVEKSVLAATAFPVPLSWSAEFIAAAKEANMAYPTQIAYDSETRHIILWDDMKYLVKISFPWAGIERISIKDNKVVLGLSRAPLSTYDLSKEALITLIDSLIGTGSYSHPLMMGHTVDIVKSDGKKPEEPETSLD